MLKRLCSLSFTSLVLASAVVSHQAWGAGFQLKEQGAGLQGLSFAGATARAKDLSTIFYNPAGMMWLNGTQAEVNVSLIRPSAEFTATSVTSATGGGGNFPVSGDSNGGDAGSLAAVPSFYIMHEFEHDPKMKFGLSVNTPYGLTTEYDEGWVGRYYALESELKTINVAPSLAYSVTDKFAIGGGVQAEYAKATLSQAVNFDAVLGGSTPDGHSKLSGDDVGFGYNFGAMYEYAEDSRLGLSYRSRIHHTLKGEIDFSNVPGAVAANPNFTDDKIKAKIALPDVLSVGLHHKLNDQWSVMGDVAWTNWSLFKHLQVANRSNEFERQNVEENWEDSYFVSLGTEYKKDDKTTYQFGVAFDKSPVKDEFRTFRIPDSDRYWLSAGYLKDLNKKWKLSAGFTHIIAKDATVTEDASPATHGDISGQYDSSVNILSLGLSYKF